MILPIRIKHPLDVWPLAFARDDASDIFWIAYARHRSKDLSHVNYRQVGPSTGKRQRPRVMQ
jgi:hypothetical protein